MTARDVVHELFHPSGTGSMSRGLQRTIWRLTHLLGRGRRRALALTGPVTLLTIVMTWTAMIALGWALLFWPYLPRDFRFASPLDPASQGGFGDALYFSLVALTTVGFGDITPVQPALRLLAAIEAGVGFAMLTAGLSWTLSIYPVLARRRSLAVRVHTLSRASARQEYDVTDTDPAFAASVLAELAASLDHIRVDLVHAGITYYFDDTNPELALPTVLPYLLELSRLAMDDVRAAEVRYSGAALHDSLSGYAEYLRTHFLRRPPMPLDGILAAYAADQAHRPIPPRRAALHSQRANSVQQHT